VRPFRDPVAGPFVDVVPVREGTLEDRIGHALAEMPHDVGDQTIPQGIVRDLAHQGARLAPVIVVPTEGVGGVGELAVGRPLLHVGVPLGVAAGPPFESGA